MPGAEDPRFTSVVHHNSRLWERQFFVDPNPVRAPFPVLFNDQRGRVVAAPTSSLERFFKDFGATEARPWKIFHLPEKHGLVAFTLDNREDNVIGVGVHSAPPDDYLVDILDKQDPTEEKIRYIASGPIPYTLLIRGFFDHQPINRRVVVNHLGATVNPLGGSS